MNWLKSLNSGILCLLIMCGVPAHALDIINPTETEKASYRIYYTGIPVGKLWFWWEANDEYYKITASVKTSGVVRLFNKQKRLAEVSGKRDGSQFVPIHYHASVTYPHKQRSTDMAYDNHRLQQVVNTPPNDLELNDAQKARALDPLSVMLQLLVFMREPPEAEELYANEIYDGKRLLRGYAIPHHAPSTECLLPCRTYALYRKPLLGYDEDDLKNYRDGEPPLYLRHNPTVSHFPISLTAEAPLGTVVVKRVEEEEERE